MATGLTSRIGTDYYGTPRSRRRVERERADRERDRANIVAPQNVGASPRKTVKPAEELQAYTVNGKVR